MNRTIRVLVLLMSLLSGCNLLLKIDRSKIPHDGADAVADAGVDAIDASDAAPQDAGADARSDALTPNDDALGD